MNTNLKDLLHSINVVGYDVDVCVDGYGFIAVCSPVKITRYGREYYAKALNATTDGCMICDVDNKVNELAWNFLYDIAGYCGTSHFAKCFEGADAKPI